MRDKINGAYLRSFLYLFLGFLALSFFSCHNKEIQQQLTTPKKAVKPSGDIDLQNTYSDSFINVLVEDDTKNPEALPDFIEAISSINCDSPDIRDGQSFLLNQLNARQIQMTKYRIISKGKDILSSG